MKGRHQHRDIDDLPAIFDGINTGYLFDFDYHKRIIHDAFSKIHPGEDLHLYVTGLTPVLVSVLNYCRLLRISVTLYHYDASTDRYVRQSVV